MEQDLSLILVISLMFLSKVIIYMKHLQDTHQDQPEVQCLVLGEVRAAKH